MCLSHACVRCIVSTGLFIACGDDFFGVGDRRCVVAFKVPSVLLDETPPATLCSMLATNRALT